MFESFFKTDSRRALSDIRSLFIRILTMCSILILTNRQEQLRKRKDEEEKQECLNRSLRGSRKLHALESHSTNLSGQENPAYAQDEFFNRSNSVASKPTNSATSQEVGEPERPLSKYHSYTTKNSETSSTTKIHNF